MARADDNERGALGGRGKGKSRGSRSSKALPREVEVSKKLSWLLRHGAAGEGLQLGQGGYINLADVLNNRKIKPLKVTLEEIKAIVKDNEKQRFSLFYVGSASTDTAQEGLLAADGNAESSETHTPATDIADPHPDRYLIRANQGHSLKVDDSELLTPVTLEASNLPTVVVHGTTRKAWPLIVASGGLKPQTRNHVHFATGFPAALRDAVQSQTAATAEDTVADALPEKEINVVLSGMRSTSTVFIFLDLHKALESGIKVGISENGVVLTEGNAEGIVPLSLFKCVEEKGGKVLVRDGSIVGQLGD